MVDLKNYKNILISAFYALLCLFIASCSGDFDAAKLSGDIDGDLGYSRDEFREKLIPKRDMKAEEFAERRRNRAPKIPEISDILTAPSVPDQVPDQLVSLSVTEDVPLKEVLVELGRMADVDMEIDPAISGGIIMSVKDRPFKDVIERIVRLGGLRYSIEQGVVKVQRDNPYQMSYEVDFLNLLRENESSTSVDTNSLGSSENQSPSGTTSTLTSSTKGGVWESIESAIKNIIGFTERTSSKEIGTSSDAESVADAGTLLQINQSAGIISVVATERQHKKIAGYLEQVRKKVSSQVLIEAKVVEVKLNEAYRSGINWSELSDFSSNIAIDANFPLGNTLIPVGESITPFTIKGGGSNNLTTAIQFIDQFGITKTLSSPRLHAMNNQPALLSFAENKVYFEIEVTEQTETNSAGEDVKTAQVTSELKTVPVGVVLSLLPSINTDTGEVTMHVRPTLSRISSEIEDPSVALTLASINADASNQQDVEISNSIPIVEMRELDSILKMKSGQIMVIGGLMKNETISNDTGVPFMSKIPFAGNLFKSTEKVSSVTETVIFIKATVIPTANSVEEPDKRLYKNFMQRDPRPLAF